MQNGGYLSICVVKRSSRHMEQICGCKSYLHWLSRMIYQYQIQMYFPSWDSWSVGFCSSVAAAAPIQSA